MMEGFETINDLINRIREDREQGASELARESLKVLQKAIQFSKAESFDNLLPEIETTGNSLIASRPAMAPVKNAVSYFLQHIEVISRDSLISWKQAAIKEIERMVSDSLKAIKTISHHARDILSHGDTLMTHSYSSTVIAALRAAARDLVFDVIVTRSGASHAGEKTARQLSLSDIAVTYIDDTAIGLCMPQASKVLLGADRICGDGTLVNGVGTYLLALAASQAGIPLYILCEKWKLDPGLTGREVDLEDKNPAEVVLKESLPEGVNVKNPYFDITPLELVTGLITEDGLVRGEEIRAYVTQH